MKAKAGQGGSLFLNQAQVRKFILKTEINWRGNLIKGGRGPTKNPQGPIGGLQKII